MKNLATAGRVLFALSLIGMAIQQLFYPEFRAIFVPETPTWLPLPKLWVYLFSFYLIGSCIIIIQGKNRNVALVLGGVLIVLFLIGHVPYRFSSLPNNLGMWTVAIKCLAFAGGAFVSAGSMPLAQHNSKSSITFFLQKLIPLGPVLFSLMLIAFGTDHFLYTTGVSRMVPAWIPGAMFWTYFAAVALIGSGTAILLRIKPQLIATLAGIMILTWVFILHLPSAINTPQMGNSNALTATFHALGFSGIAFMIAGVLTQNQHVFKNKWHSIEKMLSQEHLQAK